MDREAAQDCLLWVQAATFWEWKAGLRPMFWNYPKDQQLTMRDGVILWMKGRMDPWLQSQRLPRDPKDMPKVVKKLCLARNKGYIDIGLVQSLISFFEVPQGLTDIRMVYDGTKSGLNEMLWAPWLPLPTVDSLLRSVKPGAWMADDDVGEMFLNFIYMKAFKPCVESPADAGPKKRKAGTSAKAESRARKSKKRDDVIPTVEPMQLTDWDLEDPLSWEEKFGNFNLARFGSGELLGPPPKVAPVKRLEGDLQALHELTQSERPPRRMARLGKFARAICGFGDACKDGFGASVEVVSQGVIWRSGVWNLTIRKEWSNFREFKNLVESIENHELFMFTDNSTAAAFSRALRPVRNCLIWFCG
jgi:hypothetical protein